ncbi:hypothetical protein CCM_02274 [Cordyceps militaris CM01]|uniref:Uncharacterized protein n=1 Tax=Cordyceps militaris (strain CM01) TaxID=983644 RepID=G3J8R8_CORMM|nr:uncharacterized protein CCM_02274 [Cordyceps militaris CM01]EGX94003.1 hypothetical protein CCM_02274 [Cordyceps militaris CM01]
MGGVIEREGTRARARAKARASQGSSLGWAELGWLGGGVEKEEEGTTDKETRGGNAPTLQSACHTQSGPATELLPQSARLSRYDWVLLVPVPAKTYVRVLFFVARMVGKQARVHEGPFCVVRMVLAAQGAPVHRALRSETGGRAGNYLYSNGQNRRDRPSASWLAWAWFAGQPGSLLSALSQTVLGAWCCWVRCGAGVIEQTRREGTKRAEWSLAREQLALVGWQLAPVDLHPPNGRRTPARLTVGSWQWPRSSRELSTTDASGFVASRSPLGRETELPSVGTRGGVQYCKQKVCVFVCVYPCGARVCVVCVSVWQLANSVRRVSSCLSWYRHCTEPAYALSSSFCLLSDMTRFYICHREAASSLLFHQSLIPNPAAPSEPASLTLGPAGHVAKSRPVDDNYSVLRPHIDKCPTIASSTRASRLAPWIDAHLTLQPPVLTDQPDIDLPTYTDGKGSSRKSPYKASPLTDSIERQVSQRSQALVVEEPVVATATATAMLQATRPIASATIKRARDQIGGKEPKVQGLGAAKLSHNARRSSNTPTPSLVDGKKQAKHRRSGPALFKLSAAHTVVVPVKTALSVIKCISIALKLTSPVGTNGAGKAAYRLPPACLVTSLTSFEWWAGASLEPSLLYSQGGRAVG